MSMKRLAVLFLVAAAACHSATTDRYTRKQAQKSLQKLGVSSVGDLERMGDLAVHVAKIARMRFPEVAVPEEFRTTFKDMGHTAEAMGGSVRVTSEPGRGSTFVVTLPRSR